MYLKEKKINQLRNYFPTEWQRVIFRNYGMVHSKRIAEIISATQDIVEEHAEKMGLKGIQYNPDWADKGYITLIRNNWHILSYRQIMLMLGCDSDRLNFLLKEDDFLGVKLGRFKPDVAEPKYFPLSLEQEKETLCIKSTVEKAMRPYTKPFNYFKDNNSVFDGVQTNGGNNGDKSANSNTDNHVAAPHSGKNSDMLRMIYSYSAQYGDCLMEEDLHSFPEILLKRLAESGINAIFIQAVLSGLAYYPFNEKLCADRQTRQKNLNRLIDRCAKYGISVYLYLNEPRSLLDAGLEGFEAIKGRKIDGYVSLCMETGQVRQYLYDAVKELLSAAPRLGGMFTITMSENMTHCHYKPGNDCPICKGIPPQKIVADINNIMYKAVKDSGLPVRFIANIWGWGANMGWTELMTRQALAGLDRGIEIMAVSENALKIKKGGIKNTVFDYSISNPGPGRFALKNLKFAKKSGHKIHAKIQVNNSWELAVVPYIPVFGLVDKHISNLKKLGIDGLLYSWTVGGYPSVMLNYANNGLQKNFDRNKWYIEMFGKDSAQTVKRAVKLFSRGFSELPFDVSFLYHGAQQVGASNLLYEKPTELRATMVCYPFDNIDLWRGEYPPEVFIKQLDKLTVMFDSGIKLLQEADCSTVAELKLMAEVVYVQFRSVRLQFEFNLIRGDASKRDKVLQILQEERVLAEKLYSLAAGDARIGFEPSNHYFFYENNILEKLICLNRLTETFEQIKL